MKKLIFLSTFYLCSQFSYAQNPTFSVKEIDSIVKRIDSTCISGGITDYNFHKKGNKKKVIGGGADWFYTDTSSTKLLKAIRETSLNTENLDSYYFYQDSLIYLTISNRTYIDGKKVIMATSSRFVFHFVEQPITMVVAVVTGLPASSSPIALRASCDFTLARSSKRESSTRPT